MSVIREAVEWLVISAILLSIALLWQGCGATVTINILSSHSRYGQSIGGTNTTIKGQIEGGGALTATVPTP
jgi:hypothetical protein